MKFMLWLALGWACAWPLVASAQWQWTDKSGHPVFSDQPPPPEVPEKNILRRPARVPAAPVIATVPSASDAPTPAAAPSAPPASPGASKPAADPALEEKARKAKEDEKARQAAEAQKQARARTENCARARQSRATLDSGMRIAHVNAAGEREIMDDPARAEEKRRIDALIASDCK